MNNQRQDLSTIAERVLLVDDDENVRGLLKRHVTAFGLQSDLASNGREAVELLQSRQYGLIITDIVMPTTQNVVSEAYEMQYCRSNFKACARYKIKDQADRPADLLPDGSFLFSDYHRSSS